MTDKEEREVRRYESIGKPGDPYLPTCHIYGGTEGESMVRAADYDAANQRIRELEEGRALSGNERCEILFTQWLEKTKDLDAKGWYDIWCAAWDEAILKTPLIPAENYTALQQQTQRLVEAVENFAGACDCIFDDGGTIKGHLREALKPFQKGEANASE